jgi:hypothetical protein
MAPAWKTEFNYRGEQPHGQRDKILSAKVDTKIRRPTAVAQSV